MVEFWTAGGGSPARMADSARRLEAEGWDGVVVVDSQNLAPDPYVLLGLAATATSRLRLATGVTNPLTRHPAAAATAAATVQVLSAGRMVLGIGRGDSSLAHLGQAPAPPSVFAEYLGRLQGYLRGDDVPFSEQDGAVPVSTLGMAAGPSASRIRWLAAAGQIKVPVDVAATGPKVISIAARLADRITFAVGASGERLRWAIDIFRASGGVAPVGAYVPVMVHPSRSEAQRLIMGGVASFARFSVMHGRVVGPARESSTTALTAVHDAYDMDHHFTHGSPQSAALTPDVIDEFGIAGPPSYCIERLSELTDLGLTKLVLIGGGIGLDREALSQSRRLLVEEVLPELR